MQPGMDRTTLIKELRGLLVYVGDGETFFKDGETVFASSELGNRAADEIESLQARLSEKCRKMEESALYQHDRIVATDKRLAAAEALLREAQTQLRDQPRGSTLDDRIDAFLIRENERE